jgi:hypothetical protein
MPACSASCTTPPPAWRPRLLWRPCGARPRPRAPRPARCARLTTARAAPRRPRRPTPCPRATRGRCSASRAGPGSRARRSAAALTAAAWRLLLALARAGCVLRRPRRRLRCQLSVACHFCHQVPAQYAVALPASVPAQRMMWHVPATVQEGLRSGGAPAPQPPQSAAASRPEAPPPLTFQDFLKEADLQFLDAMRRGTSLNLADLASDPPPATLQARAGAHAPRGPALAAGGCRRLAGAALARAMPIGPPITRLLAAGAHPPARAARAGELRAGVRDAAGGGAPGAQPGRAAGGRRRAARRHRGQGGRAGGAQPARLPGAAGAAPRHAGPWPRARARALRSPGVAAADP